MYFQKLIIDILFQLLCHRFAVRSVHQIRIQSSPSRIHHLYLNYGFKKRSKLAFDIFSKVFLNYLRRAFDPAVDLWEPHRDIMSRFYSFLQNIKIKEIYLQPCAHNSGKAGERGLRKVYIVCGFLRWDSICEMSSLTKLSYKSIFSRNFVVVRRTRFCSFLKASSPK